MMNAKYSLPSQLRRYVKSPTHKRSGAQALKSRPTRSGRFSAAGSGIVVRELDPCVVPGEVAPEWLYRGSRPSLSHRIGQERLQWKPHSGQIIVKRGQRGIVQDRPTRRVGMANQQTQRENRAAARTEHRCRSAAKRSQQRRRIIGLLLGRRRLPPARSWTAPVAASVIAHDHEFICQQIGKRFEMTRVSRCPMISRTGGPLPRTS